MVYRSNKITIYKSKKPGSSNLNEELQWFCDSLGLFGDRDKDKSCFRMFIVLIKALNTGEGWTSDELSKMLGLSRGTVVHHLHKLMGSGLVVSQRNRYMLRVNKLSSLVDEIERDILRTMSELKEVAEQIDSRLEL